LATPQVLTLSDRFNNSSSSIIITNIRA